MAFRLVWTAIAAYVGYVTAGLMARQPPSTSGTEADPDALTTRLGVALIWGVIAFGVLALRDRMKKKNAAATDAEAGA